MVSKDTDAQPSATTKSFPSTACDSSPVHHSSLLITHTTPMYTKVFVPYSEVVTAQTRTCREKEDPRCSVD